jgi:hypothetical protein
VSAASGPGTAHSGVNARGRLYRWDGDRWQALALPPDSMPYALVATGDALLAGLAEGRILSSGDRGDSWAELDVRVGPITAMAAAANRQRPAQAPSSE